MSHHKHWRCIALWSLLGFLPQAYADQGPALSIFGGVEQFRWREFDTDKRELLEESGQRYNVAVNYDNLRRLNSGALYSLGGKLTLGVVDYDGETQLTRIPVQSTTTYFGMQVDALGGLSFRESLAWPRPARRRWAEFLVAQHRRYLCPGFRAGVRWG